MESTKNNSAVSFLKAIKSRGYINGMLFISVIEINVNIADH